MLLSFNKRGVYFKEQDMDAISGVTDSFLG
jgi:hypothetical protein